MKNVGTCIFSSASAEKMLSIRYVFHGAGAPHRNSNAQKGVSSAESESNCNLHAHTHDRACTAVQAGEFVKESLRPYCNIPDGGI